MERSSWPSSKSGAIHSKIAHEKHSAPAWNSTQGYEGELCKTILEEISFIILA